MWTTQLLLALSASRCLPLVHAALYENVDELPKAKYDFIIVGGEFCCVHHTRSTAMNHTHLGGTAGNTRGSSSDWDRYAKLTGDPGWSWKGIQPFLRKVHPVHFGWFKS